MTAPAPEPVHDCDDEFSPYCVDQCAAPCQCGCNPGLTAAEPSRALVILVRLLWIAAWATIGGAAGALLTFPQALVGGACLVGLGLLWKAARP